jgi:hypothetical protein
VHQLGFVTDLRGSRRHEHVCSPFDDRADFQRRINAFLADGLSQGLRVMYAGAAPAMSLREDLSAIPGLDAAIERGAVSISSLNEVYEFGEALDPDEQEQSFATAIENAVAAGFAGLRAAADATSLVATSEAMEAFCAWEHLADRLMVSRPFSGLCCFDRTQLGDETISALAAMHPVVPPGSTSFRLYAIEGSDFALAGEIDSLVQEQFAATLRRARVKPLGELVVDGMLVTYIDHRALLTLRDHALSLGTAVVLRTTSSLPGRLIDLLGIEGIRAEMEEFVPANAREVLE